MAVHSSQLAEQEGQRGANSGGEAENSRQTPALRDQSSGEFLHRARNTLMC